MTWHGARLLALAWCLVVGSVYQMGAVAQDYLYRPPGILLPANTAGEGRVGDRWIYQKGLTFPIQLVAAQHSVLNSQIYRPGGYLGPGGGQCSAVNYQMPWEDTYCENRSWNMPLCPAGVGHQGVDIRPPACNDNTWWAVAAEDGVVSMITSNTTVAIRGDSGTVYRYLHLHPSSLGYLAEGQRVSAGDPIGRVSNYMGGTPNTTIHLHFDMKQTVQINGVPMIVYVPPYTSLVDAYRALIGLPTSTGDNLLNDPTHELP